MNGERKSESSRRKNMPMVMAVIVIIILALVLVALNQIDSTDGRCEGLARCFTGTVTEIIDGDTIEVDDQKIRLALVNTPERNQAGYEEAKQFTATLCPVGSQALVDEDDGQTGGSYGRIVAVVYCGDKNLNAELVSAGHAEILQEFCDISEFAIEDWAADCR